MPEALQPAEKAAPPGHQRQFAARQLREVDRKEGVSDVGYGLHLLARRVPLDLHLLRVVGGAARIDAEAA